MMAEKQSSHAEPHYCREQVSMFWLRPMGKSEPPLPLGAGKRRPGKPRNSACSSEYSLGISEPGKRDL